MWAAISLTPSSVRGTGTATTAVIRVGGRDGNAHAQDKRSQRNQQNCQHQRPGGQFDHDIGEGEHQAAVGQHTDDNPDDADRGADLEAALSAFS